jgi:predicted RNase H-like nuclease (RuvC/YqgF family)
MKKQIILVMLILGNLSAFAQETKTLDFHKEVQPLKEKIQSLQSENNKLKTDISSINSKVATVNQKLQTLDQKVQSNASDIQKTNSELNGKITNSETTTNQKFTQVDNSLSKNSLWSIIGILGAIIVSGIVYWLVSKRQTTDKTDVEAQISKTKKTLEEEGIKLDTKLTEVLETQLKLVQEERAKIPANKSEEIDHSLALKVADEIVRINKNLSNMDASTKGLKQLSASVKRIEDTFAANGYDMPELLNKPFDSRMKIIVANSIADDNLKDGEEIITKIIKPQVNYKGVMIQSAQVEVSVG